MFIYKHVLKKYPLYLSLLRCHSAQNRIHVISVDFAKPSSVDSFVQRLSTDERTNLCQALSSASSCTKEGRTVNNIQALQFNALCLVALSNGLPFIGFGFLDNSIMILAGESIESTWGAVMGISTMAAAALGNWVSDVIGMGSAGYVEAVCHKIGIRPPDMSAQQMDLTSTRLAVVIGRCIGITIGCFLGMFPLLFFNKEKDDKQSKDVVESQTQ